MAKLAPKRTRLSPEDRRQELLETGLRLFGQQRFSDLTLEDICQQAQISRPLLHHYFGTKLNYFLEVVAYAVDKLMEECLPQPTDKPFTVAIDLLERYFDFLRSHPAAATLSMRQSAGMGEEIEKIFEPYRQATFSVTANALGGPAEKHEYALAIWAWIGMVEATAKRLLDMPSIESRTAARLIILQLFNLLESAAQIRGEMIPDAWKVFRSRVRRSVKGA